MTDKELIAKLQKAKGPSRELLQEAWTAMFPMPEGPQLEGVGEWGLWRERKRRFIAMLDAEAYESAALTLVPEEWTYVSLEICARHLPGQHCHASVERMLDEQEDVRVSGYAKTPALAIVIAALRAKGEGE